MEGQRRFGFVDARRLLAFLALFTGAALVFNIVLKVDLRLGLAVMTFAVAGAAAFTLRRLGRADRRAIRRTFGYGLVAGILATLAYDVVRVVLAALDPSPYTPFEAILRFGHLLTGSAVRDGGVILAGGLFHVLNGALFAGAFALVVVRDGLIGMPKLVLLGMSWGMFLEGFQLALYPNWLGIRYLAEFVTISALGHLAYGATLGPVARTFIRRSRREDDHG
jgi:hypothetical protein